MFKDNLPGNALALLLLVCAMMLNACGRSSDGNSVRNPVPPANSTPTIFGTAEAVATVGEQYEFTPTATDADGDPLLFSIAGQPDWASFDVDTGVLQGTPTDSDVGLFDDIIISVTDGMATASLAPFSIGVEDPGPVLSPIGLDSRPSNTSCLAVARPDTADIRLQRVFSNLSLNNVTAIVQPPNDSGAWYFTTRDGLIGRFENIPDVSSSTTILDYRGIVTRPPDGGLIQLIFHPDYPADSRIFVNYSVPAEDGVSRADIIVSSFDLSADGLSIDPQSETVLLKWPRGHYHQGGFLSFDHDNLLLIGLGDGAEQGDPDGHAQNLANLLGKVLRIDLDSGAPYGIPNDNPFAGSGGFPLEEIYAFGVRNAFRGDIDSETGKVYIGDVGFGSREEISAVLRGANLGWNIKEGALCHSEQYGSCSDSTLVDPLVEYDHSGGNCAVIGGFFYRGQEIPELIGRFLFADYCSAKISAVELDDDGQPFELSLLPGGTGLGNISTFAKDNDGELYVVTSSQIHKIMANTATPGPSGPAPRLSETGCFDANDPTIPVPGLIPYSLQSALWSDGATKRRWIAIPEGRTIDVSTDGDFLFPDGTVLVKEFSIQGEPVETRLLMKDETGVWGGYAYEWIGDDAFLLPASKQKVLSNGQIWHFPDRGECLRCHTDEANFSLGPEIGQLNGNMTYLETHRISNQLATMEHIGVLTNGLPSAPEQLPALAGLDDIHQAMSRRARSYLHSNCSGCHRGEGVTQSDMDLRFSASRTDMNVCNITPSFGDLGVTGANIVSPGQPDSSILVTRPSSTDPLQRMPPLATIQLHDVAISTLRSWIESSEVCATESDSDLDSVADDADNCPGIANPNQSDVDEDGDGDVCDAN